MTYYSYNKIHKINGFILVLIAVLAFGYGAKSVFAQTSEGVLYVPLIGITSVPSPLALPQGAGTVTYKYAVKSFIPEASLANVRVADDKCSPVVFVEGDDNGDSILDFSETWRYACTTKVSVTTENTVTAMGTANDITATHRAHSAVVVGSNNPPPLVSVVNVTKVALPLSLPAEGGDITFTYKVNNPGVIPLSDVTVTDDKCSPVSGKLGDTNVNNLLDIHEVWVYTCTMALKQTTTNTVHVTAFSNGLKAVGEATITVRVGPPIPGFPDLNIPGFPGQEVPGFPETGAHLNFKIIIWSTLAGLSAALIAFFILTRKIRLRKK